MSITYQGQRSKHWDGCESTSWGGENDKHDLPCLSPEVTTFAFYLYNVRINRAINSYHDSLLQQDKRDKRLIDFVLWSRFDHSAQTAQGDTTQRLRIVCTDRAVLLNFDFCQDVLLLTRSLRNGSVRDFGRKDDALGIHPCAKHNGTCMRSHKLDIRR